MQTASLQNSIHAPEPMGITDRLAEIVFNPAAVFAEIKSAPCAPVNWLAPLLLALLSAVLSIAWTSDSLGGEKLGAAFVVAIATIAGTFWSATVLWFIARLILRANISFARALEIFGMAQVIFVLGTIATTLLIVATGNPHARPAASILLGNAPSLGRSHIFLAALNPFHFWGVAVISRGLSTFTGVTFAEAAFWAFGYWIVLKTALELL